MLFPSPATAVLTLCCSLSRAHTSPGTHAQHTRNEPEKEDERVCRDGDDNFADDEDEEEETDDEKEGGCKGR